MKHLCPYCGRVWDCDNKRCSHPEETCCTTCIKEGKEKYERVKNEKK